MATVAELKDEAVKLGLTGISKLKKADLETLISEARQAEAQRTADARQAESVTEATAEARQAEEVRKGKRIASMMKTEKTLADIQTARQAESVTEATAEAVPSDPRAARRALADTAGKRATVTSPMSDDARKTAYVRQNHGNGATLAQYGNRPKKFFTFAQCRRMRKADNRALKTA